jgi:hypothetical protein
MEDNLNFKVNGRRSQFFVKIGDNFFGNMEDNFIFFGKWKMT